MRLGEEFIAGYSCQAPDNLPEELNRRLSFLSCLRTNEQHSVFLVEERSSGEKQILKITGQDAPNNLGQEYQLLKKLDHAGIPKVFYYYRDTAGREYLLREYAKGDTLRSLLERDGVFSEAQTLQIAGKICEILGYLHSQTPPVIYRDITPENIVLTPNGKLSLIDFGISRRASAEKNFDTVYLGSTAFASPEQFGFTRTDPRSDIFAIGKLMIYLATGETDLQAYDRLIESRGLKAMIAKCTRLSPEQRYRSVARLAAAIRRQLAPPTRKEYLAAAVSTVLVVTAGLLLMFNRLKTPDEPEQPPAPIRAEGGEAAEEVKIPVRIQVQNNGAAYDDCAVAVDNHHWYQPAPDGIADLFAFAYENYSVRAASGNRTAIQDTAVTRAMEEAAFTFDFELVPEAPEYIEVEAVHGQAKELVLAVEGADQVVLTGEPPGVSVVRKEDRYTLLIDQVEQPGHYTIMAEWSNQHGIADSVISLTLSAEKNEITYIRTAAELDRIRANLGGHYELAADIDLSENSSWQAIGTEPNPFTGILDGKGHQISGLAIAGQTGVTGIFGYCDRARISNVIMRTPEIQSVHVTGWGIGMLVGVMEKGIIENCAVLGGGITADTNYYSAIGGICGRNSGIIRSCFNSADITVTDLGRSGSDSIAGGICGENFGYILHCGNAGAVSSAVMAGGITGFCDGGYITGCYNVGSIQAPVYYGDYPPGGITHLLGRGYRVSYCAFAEGTAPVGGTVWNRGTLLGIEPLTDDEVRDPVVLSDKLGRSGMEISFVHHELAGDYPIPEGITEHLQ